MVLIICLSIAEDGISWKLNAVQRLPEGGVHILDLQSKALLKLSLFPRSRSRTFLQLLSMRQLKYLRRWRG